jgi:putative addiction module component (TIGR02574 family)
MVGAMARILTKDEISKLAVGERLDLISELWDSLSPNEIPLPEAHRRALDEAFDEYQRDPEAGRSCQEIRDELFRKK